MSTSILFTMSIAVYVLIVIVILWSISRIKLTILRRQERIFGSPPGPDVRVGDIVRVVSPPIESHITWHPALTRLPVVTLFTLSEINGTVGLVVSDGEIIHMTPPPMKGVPKSIPSVNILSSDGRLCRNVPVLTLHVFSRLEE